MINTKNVNLTYLFLMRIIVRCLFIFMVAGNDIKI